MSNLLKFQVYLATKILFILIFVSIITFSILLLVSPEAFINSLNAGQVSEYKGYYFLAASAFSYLVLISILSLYIAYDPIKYRDLMFILALSFLLNVISLIFMSTRETGAIFVFFTVISFVIAITTLVLYFMTRKVFK